MKWQQARMAENSTYVFLDCMQYLGIENVGERKEDIGCSAINKNLMQKEDARTDG